MSVASLVIYVYFGLIMASNKLPRFDGECIGDSGMKIKHMLTILQKVEVSQNLEEG